MKAITYKEKKEELEKIFRGYHRAQMKLQYLKEKSYYPSIQMDTIRERKSYYQDKGTQWIDSLYSKEELEKNYPDKNILVVCHGGIVRVIHSYFNDMTNEELMTWLPENCCIQSYEK